MQPHERLGDPGVGDMALEVDAEEVVAQRLTGGPRLDAREVDPAHGELVEDRHESAGLVEAHEQAERRLVGTRGRRDRARQAHEDEAGRGVLGVADAVGEDVEPVPLGGEPRRHRRVEGRRILQEGRGRSRRGQGRDDRRARKSLVDPAAHLGQGVGMRGEAADVGQGRARSREEGEPHRQGDLVDDHQPPAAGELVERHRHRSLDRVLDRDECRVDRAVAHRVDRRLH